MNKKILLTAAVLLPLSLFGQEKKGPIVTKDTAQALKAARTAAGNLAEENLVHGRP